MSQDQTGPVVTPGDIGQFVMELASLIGIGLIGWHLGGKGILGTLLVVVFILFTGWIWGRYRTPGFVPTGRPPAVEVSGPVRIALEIMVYAIGIFGLWWTGHHTTMWVVIAVMLITLALSHKRYIALWNTRT